MRFTLRVLFLFAVGICQPGTAAAQLCFDIFEELTDPSLSCADAFYFVDGPDGEPDSDFFGDADSGLLGAGFDGFDLFDDPADPLLEPPDNLLEPFFSRVDFRAQNQVGEIFQFQVTHRGSVSMGARNSNRQEASFGSVSRLRITPFTTDGSTAPVPVNLNMDLLMRLVDPSANAGGGGALGGAGVRILDASTLDALFEFNGFTDLDLELADEPRFFGDFDGSASATPGGPGIDDAFDIELELDSSFDATPGRPLVLDTNTFGAIFSDGFESGDTSAWTAASPDSFVIGVGSDNPNVRFQIDYAADPQPINYGHAGGWFNTQTPGQGFLFDFLLESQFMFVAAFTFDTLGTQTGGNIPGAEQRWFTAQGFYSGNRAELTIYKSRRGVFDDPAPVSTLAVGTMVIEFTSCTTAVLTYHLPVEGLSGTIPISKLLADEICTAINEGDIQLKRGGDSAPQSSHETQEINYGLIGGWYNPETDGQGFLFDFLTTTDFMFVAAFTFDTISPQSGGHIEGAEQRWFTAQGNYSGNRAELLIFQTRNGVFDDPAATETTQVGTMVIEFTSCTTATLTYDMPGFGLSGSIPLTKLLADEICTAINDGGIVVAR